YEVTRPLRQAGVQVHLWPRPSTMHRKGVVFDGRFAYFGSDNLDRRGQDRNSESVIFSDDVDAVRQMARDLDRDFALAGEPVSEALAQRDLDAIPDVVK